MEYYVTEKLSGQITCIRGGAGERCWLVEGERAAALIDGTCGHASLGEVVARLTSRRVTVLMTHGHRDHIGGAWAFGEAYLHPADIPLTRHAFSGARRAAFARDRAPDACGDLAAEDFPEQPVEWRPLKEGDVFDLGGTVLEVLELPGHTAGSVCFLDRAGRNIFTGDICTRRTLMMLPESLKLSVLKGTLERLQALAPLYDRHFIGHDPGLPGPNALENLLECVEAIRCGCDDHVPYAGAPGLECWLSCRTSDAEQQLRADGKYGNIVYRWDQRGTRRPDGS